MLQTMLSLISGIIISYLIGSIPTAFLLGKIIKRIDIRDYGSGNIGATNAFRVLGKIPGALVLIIDIFKGLICPTIIADVLNITQEFYRILLGVSVVSGHNWTIFLKFKGGKGIATSLGVLIGLAIEISSLRIVLILTCISWLVVFLISGFISLSSMVAALSLPILMLIFPQPFSLIVLGIIFCLFVFLRHRPNIERLLKKKEPKVNISFLKRKRFP